MNVSESGSVVVTGATGGVGSMAVYLLAMLGYSVIAVTGKMDQKPLLELLGAKKVIHRDDLYPEKKALLNSGIYSAAIDKFISAKNTDNTITDLANKKIASYSKHLPSKEDAFFNNYNEGDSYMIDCWINESTKVRIK